jgi:molybdopterin-guanine dinucleotide biosynthesis protein
VNVGSATKTQSTNEVSAAAPWRLIVVGGHTRSIGKTQLVCDIITAFPQANWIGGKITQYGHGVCAQNGNNCDCAPEEHVCAIEWETESQSGTDSARFLAAGAKRSFWLRTKQGFLAEGLPLMREALREVLAEEIENADAPTAVILESNSLMQFLKPSLYFAVIHPAREDFKDSARAALDRADALVLRGSMQDPAAPASWLKLPASLLRTKPSVTQGEGEPLPEPLHVLVERVLQSPPSINL